jgi:hypothetical protein
MWNKGTCNNQGAITLSKDNKFHTRTKHIDIKYHFIREAVEDKKIEVIYIPTDDNTSDIFTKPLTKLKFCRFVEMLGLQEVCKKKVLYIGSNFQDKAFRPPPSLPPPLLYAVWYSHNFRGKYPFPAIHFWIFK